MKRKNWKQLLGIGVALAVPFVASAQIIVNGSFNNTSSSFNAAGGLYPGVDPGTMVLGPSSTTIPGWTVSSTGGNIAWVNGANLWGYTASPGNGSAYLLDLTGYENSIPYGGIAASTAFSVTGGHTYQLSFALGTDNGYRNGGVGTQANGDLVGSSPAITFTVDGNPAVTDPVLVAAGAAGQNQWTTETYQWTVPLLTTSDSISFVGAGPNNEPYIGLDNVSVTDITPVPEPSTVLAGVLTLLPFGASALRILRKRQAA